MELFLFTLLMEKMVMLKLVFLKIIGDIVITNGSWGMLGYAKLMIL